MKDIRSIKMINTQKKNPQSLGVFQQRSNVKIILDLFDENMNYVDVTGQSISLRVMRADNVEFEQINDITSFNNKVTINLKNEVLEVIGKCKCQLNLSDDSGQFTTSYFTFEVGDTILTDDIVLSSDHYESLEKALILFKAESKALMDEFTENENIRITNENNRKAEELKRDSLEKIRIENEDARKIQEENRVNTENERNNVEISRNEQEEIRQQQEMLRQSTFETNELERTKKSDDNIQYMLDDYNNLKFQILDENVILQLQIQLEDLYKKIEVIENGGCGHNKVVLTERGLITTAEDNRKITTGGILNVL